uniref:CAP-Gly domain-containing protein n=1 Tax=Amorphochlora amoebiformis TaxID=1561963 RepID=A0A6T6VN09_9EUKA
MANLQMQAPKVTTLDGKSVSTSDWIKTTITHSILEIRTEKSYNPKTTGEELKEKLHLIVGTKPAHMILELRDQDGKRVCNIDDKISLGSLPISKSTCYVHVIDTDPHKTLLEFTDVSRVKKFELTDEEYDNRKDTFRKWAQKALKGHYQTLEKEKKVKAAQEEEEEGKEAKLAEGIKKGDRCQLGSGSEFPRRGEVAFIGKVDGKPGTWIGVCLDEPFGKNNGSVNGKKYFHAMPKCGVFVKPSAVEVGDFPEEDMFEEL